MKTYILAGASGTVAKVVATHLNDLGHRVITISRGEALPESAQHINVTSYRQTELPEWKEPIDGLVYFPGTIRLKPFHRISTEEFLEDFQINTVGAIEMIRHFLPALQQSGNASIVLVSSVAARLGMPFHASVSTSKGALESLAIALAAEYTPTIRVNVVAPSLMDTAMGEKFLNTEEKRENARKRNPMKHIGTPENLSDAIAFLLTENSAWMTGQVLAVDGGMKSIRLL